MVEHPRDNKEGRKSKTDKMFERTPLAQEDALACGGVARGEGVQELSKAYASVLALRKRYFNLQFTTNGVSMRTLR
jgi:hypothetical protein